MLTKEQLSNVPAKIAELSETAENGDYLHHENQWYYAEAIQLINFLWRHVNVTSDGETK